MRQNQEEEEDGERFEGAGKGELCHMSHEVDTGNALLHTRGLHLVQGGCIWCNGAASDARGLHLTTAGCVLFRV